MFEEYENFRDDLHCGGEEPRPATVGKDMIYGLFVCGYRTKDREALKSKYYFSDSDADAVCAELAELADVWDANPA